MLRACRNLDILDRYKEEVLVEGVWSSSAICSQLLENRVGRDTTRVEAYKITLVLATSNKMWWIYQWKLFRRKMSLWRASQGATDIIQLSGRKQIPFILQCCATNTSASEDERHVRNEYPEEMTADKQRNRDDLQGPFFRSPFTFCMIL